MSTPATPPRLALTRLDDRTVPSTVTVTTTARPFNFVGTGTLTTTDQTTAAPLLTDTSTNAVTLTGTIDYTSNTTGQATSLTLSGTGTGNQIPTPVPLSTPTTTTSTTTPTQTATTVDTTPSAPGASATSTAIGAYAQTIQGQWSLTDTNGAIATGPQALAAVRNYVAGVSTTGTLPLGPDSPTGTLDVSTFKLNAGWNQSATGTTSQGTLALTLANATSQPTTFTLGNEVASLASDGSVSVGFSVAVTGNVLNAASETTAATNVTAMWVGGTQTQSASINLPIFWNTGTLTASVSGLIAPSWAQQLVIAVDANHTLTGVNETNATWTVNLSTLPAPSPPVVVSPPVTASPPPGTTSPPVTASPPTTTSPPPTTSPPVTASPPTTTSPPPVVTPVPPTSPPPPSTLAPTSFDLTTGPDTLVEFRNSAGQVIGDAAAFPSFSGPIAMAVADLNGDSVPDVVIAAGAGGGPRIKLIDGATGNTLLDFFAFNTSFRGGVNVAVSSEGPDNIPVIIASEGAGGSPEVRVFNAQNGNLLSQFNAYDSAFTGGVSVAAADLNNSGQAQIITGAGAGGGPIVQVFDLYGNPLDQVMVAPVGSRTGVNVSATTNPSTGNVTVSADPIGASASVQFQGQLTASGPLLNEIEPPTVTVPPTGVVV